MEFKVGDKVKAFGLKGTVIERVNKRYQHRFNIIHEDWVRVRFENGREENFFGDGKFEEYHRSPSLEPIHVLVEYSVHGNGD